MPVVMDADRMGRTLTRIAHEILERNRDLAELALVGIRTRGAPIARRLAGAIHEREGRLEAQRPRQRGVSAHVGAHVVGFTGCVDAGRRMGRVGGRERPQGRLGMSWPRMIVASKVSQTRSSAA